MEIVDPYDSQPLISDAITPKSYFSGVNSGHLFLPIDHGCGETYLNSTKSALKDVDYTVVRALAPIFDRELFIQNQIAWSEEHDKETDRITMAHFSDENIQVIRSISEDKMFVSFSKPGTKRFWKAMTEDEYKCCFVNKATECIAFRRYSIFSMEVELSYATSGMTSKLLHMPKYVLLKREEALSLLSSPFCALEFSAVKRQMIFGNNHWLLLIEIAPYISNAQFLIST